MGSAVAWLILFVSLPLLAGRVQAQAVSPVSPPVTLDARIEGLERRIDAVTTENRRLSEELRRFQDQSVLRAPAASTPLPPAEAPGPALSPPVPTREFDGPPAQDGASMLPPTQSWIYDGSPDEFRLDYDSGFVILPEAPSQQPFSLRVRSQNVFRYNGFTRGADQWTDSAGNQIPTVNSSYFGVPRGRLIFSGMAWLPRLTYLLNIDYNSVTSNPIGFRAYELGYQFNRGFGIYGGQTKVPGTREWIESAFAALEGPDRTMATTFFRPSLSQGIWIAGEPVDDFFYQAMMCNGFNTLNLQPNRFDDRYCWSGSAWWEPWGDFGRGYADFEDHKQPVVRLGASYTFSTGEGSQSLSDAVENAAIRLSDGTLITQTGAFAPGVTLQTYDISLAAIDFAYKHRGLSVSTEWFAQNLLNLQGDGPLPLSSTQAYGGFLQGGIFIRPRTLELYARSSFVTGRFGSGSELGGGLNWFILPGRSNLRCTLDATWLNHSPADQNRTGLVAGQTGVLFRPQIVAVY